MVDKVRELVMKHWYVGEGRAAKPSVAAVLATLRANGVHDEADHLVKTDANIGRLVMGGSNILRKLIRNGAASIKIIDVKGETFEYVVEAPAKAAASVATVEPAHSEH